MKNLLKSSLFFPISVLLVLGEPSSKFRFEESTCNLLEKKFAASIPWTSYPIVFEPITRGRLTIWTGVNTLPTSEFRCHANQEAKNKSIALNFSSIASKIDWTFYDMSRGSTHHGISVIHCEDVKFMLAIKNKQSESYLECNTLENIEFVKENATSPSIRTSCPDCGPSVVALINNQIEELINLKFNDQMKENVYWHVTQLLSNQHFDGPISFKD